MSPEADGWFGIDVEAAEGTPYAFLLPDGMAVPDPAARRQEGDVHGPSLLTAPPADDPWDGWSGRPWEEAVIYEMHIGTFTARRHVPSRDRQARPRRRRRLYRNRVDARRAVRRRPRLGL